MDETESGLAEDRQLLRELLEFSGLNATNVAKSAGLAVTTITRPLKGEATSRISVPTLKKLQRAFPKFPQWPTPTPDLPETDPHVAYVEIEVLPTFAGMGGGGSGDGESAIAMLPRALVEHELRADPADLLLINVRGDSMFDPETGRGFVHGDQLLIDRRDTNPRQPGAFALWYDDGYVVKNLELIRRTGKLRIFSNNPAYTPDEADFEDVKIMGRPVWFARRL